MLGLEVSFRLKTRVGLLSTYKFPLTCGIVRCVASGRKLVTECIEPRGLEGPRSPVHRGTSTPSLNAIRGPPPPPNVISRHLHPPEHDFEVPELPPPLNMISRHLNSPPPLNVISRHLHPRTPAPLNVISRGPYSKFGAPGPRIPSDGPG